jgi:hypothetical protein
MGKLHVLDETVSEAHELPTPGSAGRQMRETHEVIGIAQEEARTRPKLDISDSLWMGLALSILSK